MCAEMVTINRGLPVADVMRAAGEFFEEKMLDGFFPEMKDLVFRLHDIGSEVWAVSSTSEWVIQAGMKHFGIPASRDSGSGGCCRGRQGHGQGHPRAQRKRQAASHPRSDRANPGRGLRKFHLGCRYAGNRAPPVCD